MKFLNNLSIKIGLEQCRGKSMRMHQILYDFLDKVTWPYREIRYQVKCFIRACSFFKTGYKNFDFDWCYLIKLMEFKLQRMERCIRDGDSGENAKLANQVKVAIVLCKRIFDSNYLENALKPHREKWGIQEWISIPCEDNPYLYQHKYKKFSKTKNEEENKRAEKELEEVYKKSDLMEKQDLEYLFNYLKKNLKKWWD